MASGLAVAGFDYAAARQFIRDGENGLSVPCDQPEALIAAGVRLATDESLRLRLRRSARAAVENQSWENVIGRFETDLLAAAGVAGPLEPVPLPMAHPA
jgi:glycosyltransferase involved in cell wall biosynthesis